MMLPMHEALALAGASCMGSQRKGPGNHLRGFPDIIFEFPTGWKRGIGIPVLSRLA